MELIKPKIKDYPGRHIELTVDKPGLDFEQATDLAKQKAKEFCQDPMLLSWYQGKTGKSYPNVECGTGDKPAWIVFAESRGGDLTIDVNAGQFVFIYLSL
ncbi:MAG: AF1514 family protein [Desulfobacterales bacterium]|nr:AF1514 family protein [Desulfobacterales bacterium]